MGSLMTMKQPNPPRRCEQCGQLFITKVRRRLEVVEAAILTVSRGTRRAPTVIPWSVEQFSHRPSPSPRRCNHTVARNLQLLRHVARRQRLGRHQRCLPTCKTPPAGRGQGPRVARVESRRAGVRHETVSPAPTGQPADQSFCSNRPQGVVRTVPRRPAPSVLRSMRRDIPARPPARPP